MEPVAKGVDVSFTDSLRVWPVKNRAFSSSTRPQPWQLAGMAVVPAMFTAELTSVALSSAAEGVKPLAGFLAPVGHQPPRKYWRMRAVKPVAPGEAMLVPERVAVPQLLVVTLRSAPAETMFEPGTVMSG